MNPVRCLFIRDALCRHFARDARLAEPLSGLRLLDVGCGGGILCVCAAAPARARAAR
jgi:2-polyprenyl-3-methyl-5-hydroxy-6-metoxy-1,4-benzoquinol methylase